MTKAAALYQFFSSFGMPAYTSTSVPDDVTFPYLTYEFIPGAWEEGPVSLTVKAWFRTTSEAIPNAKAQEISDRIGRGGTNVFCDGGYIKLLRGSPFGTPLSDEVDMVIKGRYFIFTAIYYTEN